MQQNEGNSVVFILGGVRSGKSRYAQQLAEQFARVTFVATAERRDDEEMHRKIDRHRAERPAHWTTVEEPLVLGRVVQSIEHDCDAILIDCLTLFGANLLEAYGSDEAGLNACVDMLFNSPSEVESSPYLSGRSSDLRIIELEQPSQDLRPSGLGQIAKLSALTATG